MFCSLFNYFKKIVLAGTVTLALINAGCAVQVEKNSFDPKTCLPTKPQKISGVRILAGPRTEQSILVDMRYPYCNGQVSLKLMNEEGQSINPGSVLYKVVVEYTGEVISAEVIESDIDSEKFLDFVSGFIMETDFSFWQRNDEDTEFIYPMSFYVWWE